MISGIFAGYRFSMEEPAQMDPNLAAELITSGFFAGIDYFNGDSVALDCYLTDRKSAEKRISQAGTVAAAAGLFAVSCQLRNTGANFSTKPPSPADFTYQAFAHPEVIWDRYAPVLLACAEGWRKKFPDQYLTVVTSNKDEEENKAPVEQADNKPQKIEIVSMPEQDVRMRITEQPRVVEAETKVEYDRDGESIKRNVTTYKYEEMPA